MPIVTQAGPLGGSDFPYVRPYPLNAFTAAVAAWPAISQAFFFRVRVAKSISITTISFFVGTASGNVDVGVFTSTDGGSTLTLARSSGSTAVAGSSAWQDVALTSAYVLNPGIDYWLAISVDNTTCTSYRVAVQAPIMLRKNMGLIKASLFPLANTSSLSGATAIVAIEAG